MSIHIPDSAPETPRLSDEENIIPMSGEAAEELDIVLANSRKDAYCPRSHRRVVVDAHRRMLICQDCAKVIDPFDYVHQWARDGGNKNRALVNIEAKLKVANAQFVILEKRIDSMRGKLNRDGSPQSPGERMEYRSQLANAGIQS